MNKVESHDHEASHTLNYLMDRIMICAPLTAPLS